jgi:dihydroflavonol-4-reductase
MKVLLTGANGFVGSHVLDRLLELHIPTAVLLRPQSDRAFIATQLPRVEIRNGSLDDSASLDAALEGITHIIHCAGATKALSREGFFAVNQLGTRHLLAAVNHRGTQIQRFLLVSSLAAAGPATKEHPKHESDKPEPVSDYGLSKLAAEAEVLKDCKAEWTIVRPPAVYGPRDREFLRLFKAVKSHVRPSFGGGQQPLSFVFAPDLANAIVAALMHPNAAREIFFAGAPEVVTAGELIQCVAAEMKVWTLRLPLPNVVLWLACQWAEFVTRLTRKANVLSAQKWQELKAPGWVCDASKLKGEVGYDCRTTLAAGIVKTRAWYEANGWL